MQVIVDKHTVTIVKNEIVNEGEYNVQSCNFQFSSDYDGLPKIAIFKTGTVTKQIMLSGNTCITPEEVLQTTGIVGLGVYAYQTDEDNLTLRYSPTPAVFTVEPGSYDEGDAPTPPTPSIVEQLQEEITQNANNITSLENVTSTHTTQIETLQTDVDNIKTEQITQNNNIQTNANDISNIKTEQITQNNNIQANADDISTLQTSLSNETTNRENADINLQQQIDAITSSSDIVDIVGTYAQLMAYDTQHLSNNDVIKVLQDETHENAMTYYRWDKHNSQWIYIGQEAPYYTKSETDTLLQGKANVNDVYTKNQIDDTLEDYALKTDLTDFITEQEVDTKLNNYVDTTTYTQGQATQDANIEENASNIDWLQTLVNQMPHVAGQGTDLSLESVLNYRLMKFLPQGVSKQESTTGKNLFNINNISRTTINISGTQSEFSISQLNNNVNTEIPIVFKENTAYTISGYYSSTRANGSLRVTYTDNTSENIYGVFDNSTINKTAFTYTSNNNKTISLLEFRLFTNGNFTIYDFQIEEGSTATPYEPYTGEIPAPNPDYPYMPSRVTGENGVVIQSKNLFNPNDTYIKDYNCSITVNNNILTFQNLVNYSNNDVAWCIPIDKTKDITISWSNLTTSVGDVVNTGVRYYFTDTVPTTISSSTQISNTDKHATITPTGKYLILVLRTRANYTAYFTDLMVSYQSDLIYIEHEEQNYQLSLGNIELNSSPDGTIRDGIIGKPNEWYKREYIGKVVLDGSENWTFVSNSAMKFSLAISGIAKPVNQNTLPKMLSDNFRQSTWNNAINSDDDYLMAVSTSNEILRIKDNDFSTLADFKAWLSTHNTTIYYPLAQYTDIPITDTTLINQLNDIYNNAHSYNGVTNITTTYEDGNEQMYLDIEALKNVWEVTE